MESLNSMEAFVEVVEAESFSGAARKMGVPKSTLSRRISRLEDRLGVQLLLRTTRQLSLTDLGRRYFERCRRIVADIRDAEAEVREANAEPRGVLRVTMPTQDGSALFAKVLAGYLERYPEVDVHALVTNRFVHLVDEGFDIALRAGRLSDSNLIARQLMSASHTLVASPDYLEAHGEPADVDDLRDHECLVRESPDGGSQWTTADGRTIRVSGRLRANDIGVVKQATLAGLGLAILPSPMVTDALRDGRLVEVLVDEMRMTTGVYAVFPPGRQVSAKVRAFIDYAVEVFEDAAPSALADAGGAG